MKKNILIFSLIFSLSFVFGFFGSNLFSRYINSDQNDKTVIINKTEEVYVSSGELSKKIIDKNKDTVVYVRSFKSGSLLSSGFGFVISSDGLVVTRKELVFSGKEKINIIYNGRSYDAKFLREDTASGLVLLSSNLSNAKVASFASFEDLLLGDRVFVFGRKDGIDGDIDFMNLGIIKSIDSYLVETNIKERPELVTGLPLLNSNGDVVGVNFVRSDGYVVSISNELIKSLMY